MSRRLRKTVESPPHAPAPVVDRDPISSKPLADGPFDQSGESAASPPEESDAIIEQAAADLSHGLKDTDRSPQMNVTYKKLTVKP